MMFMFMFCKESLAVYLGASKLFNCVYYICMCSIFVGSCADCTGSQ